MYNTDRYLRNQILITAEQQRSIKNTKVILAGSGLGSLIAETALRLGFERLVLVDGDQVEMSNLNRQNYTQTQVKQLKNIALKERLLNINPDAQIECFNHFLTLDNLDHFFQTYVTDTSIAINALDYDTNQIPLHFDKYCLAQQIPVIHPANFSWAAVAFVIAGDHPNLEDLASHPENFGLPKGGLDVESNLIGLIMHKGEENGIDFSWAKQYLHQIQQAKIDSEDYSFPQLSMGAYAVAGLITSIMLSLTKEKNQAKENSSVKYFPEMYINTLSI
ncbi:MAG: ThiF family adenylyltransferase [Saprospiraceae bacterium]|nr:ThiF family adenylyltransferase [Saprospiraceae bacterium]